MELKQIEISCYKSFIGQNLKVTDRCMGFVGLNESGKTNALNAIRMLDWSYRPTQKEKSKLNDCLPHVVFHFDLAEDETVDLRQRLYEAFEGTIDSQMVNIIDRNSIQIKSITIARGLLENGELSEILDFDYDFACDGIGGLLIIAEDVELPENTQMQLGEETITLRKGMILERSKVVDSELGRFSQLSKEYVKDQLRPLIKKELANYVPKVVFWEYSDKYLIPSEITYDLFMKEGKPDEVSKPLYNIFKITSELKINNTTDLASHIQVWKQDASRRRKDTEVLNEAINKYIKNIWKEYDQDFVIDLEANEITIHVKDPESPNRNFYEMSERSQGFKTFISFLLTIAAESRLQEISNFVLVLDEPETHLHPSGVRFMRDELSSLAEQKNYVFFATHSIFMIDRNKLKRNIIIEKVDEYSMLKKVERNNITQESVIYEAMGTRLDEFSIPMRNIMFEGSIDRQLFAFNLENCCTKRENVFKDYELLDGGGTAQILRFFKDKVVPQESTWRLILDNDKPAQNLVTELEKIFPAFFKQKIVVSYYSGDDGRELEDILPIQIVQKVFDFAKKKVVPELTAVHELVREKPIASQVKEFAGRNSIDEEKTRDIEKYFKEKLEEAIDEELTAIISAGKTIKEKKELFEEKFKDYSDFALNYFSEYQKEKK